MRLKDTFSADTWLNVWMVIDNQKDLYSVYLQGGTYEAPELFSMEPMRKHFSHSEGQGAMVKTVIPLRLPLIWSVS